MIKMYMVLAMMIASSLNFLALYLMIKILKSYSHAKDSLIIDRSVRKAYVSKKKHEIAYSQIRRARGKIFRLSLYQFFIPTFTFFISIILYMTIAQLLPYRENPLIIYMEKPCIAPIPIQYPYEKGCLMYVSWIFFLIFLLYLPLYSYYTKKYLES